jgi:branched-chain amino acid transport system permease protein
MIEWLQFFINGASLGSLYALIAVGYSLVYGSLKFVNFAHGDLYMLGSYFVMQSALFAFPMWFSIPFAFVICGLVSVLIYKIVYKPLLQSNRLFVLIAAVAVSLFLESAVQIIFSPNVQSFPYQLPENIIFLGDTLVVRVADIIITSIALGTAFFTWIFIEKTKIGLGIRAVASNSFSASIVGISVHKIISVTFFIGAVLATLAGTLQGMSTNQLTPFMGIAAGLKAFAAAVLGGIGNIWGAVLGGFLIGFAESIFIGFGYSSLKDSFAYVLLIFILFFLPQGLLGKKQLVKV